MIDRRRLLRRGMDQVSAWLPALLMVLFALGTWWLVRSAPEFHGAASQAPVSPDPDYFMHDFSVRVFLADGRMKSELSGTEGRHFPIDDTLEVMQPRMRSYDEQGHPTVATGKRGVSNADASEIKLYGDARVVREPVVGADGKMTPRLEFYGEFLHAFVDEKRVSSDQPVTLWRGNDVLVGDTFDYDDKNGIATLRGRVRSTLPPHSRQATAAP
ncbi:MAG: LPS export ABC transporter periplasmic protein LptC [Burkholderiaceae bacterium]|nr:LPS export ABC transporter periplasmic protein LptC [Burkholderiaceae bacterium]